MVAQVLPQWQINQVFSSLPTATTKLLRALIMGPAYKVQRSIPLVGYAAADVTAGWPNLGVGDVVDQAFTSVILKGASQRYANLLVARAIQVKTGTNNVLKATGGLNWIANPANPAGYPRDAGLPVDVAIGDWIRVTNGANSLVTSVLGLSGTVVPAVTAAAVHAGSPATQAGSTAVSHSGTGTCIATATVGNPTSYHGEGVGVLNETYTITVTDASAGAAIASVSSTAGSGTDAAQVVNLAFSTTTPIGSRGASIAFGATGTFVVGDTFTLTVAQTYTQNTLTSSGTYTGLGNTTYVVTVVRGGSVDGTGLGYPMVSVSTSDASDAGVPRAITATAFPVGTKGVQGTFGAINKVLVLGDSWTIAATAALVGNYTDLILADALPVVQFPLATSFGVELGLVSNVTVPANRVGAAPLVNWVGGPTSITLKAGISTTSARTGALALPVQTGAAVVTMRALQTALADQVYDVTTSADILALLGADDSDAVLAYGAYRAISNAGGLNVKVLPLASDDAAGYAAALATLTNRDDFYRIVPLTYDAASQAAVTSVVNQRSTPTQGNWVTEMLAEPMPTILPVVSAAKLGVAHLGTIADPLGGSNYNTLTDLSALFIAWGVKVGDQLRVVYTNDGFGNLTYTTVTVKTVLSEQSLNVTSALALPVATASLYEIWHPLSVGEQVSAWGQTVGALANRRVTVAFPPNPGRLGTTVPAYFLACSLAAMRCAAAPQQGLTNAEVLDWDSMAECTGKFAAYLDQIANYGAYIVTQNPAGNVFIRKQLTTDLSDTRKAEDSATVNFDSISYFLLDTLAPFVGVSNVVDSNIKLMEAAINEALGYLGTQTAIPGVGPQLVDGQLQYLRPHAVLLDTVVAQIQGSLPIPLNNGQLDIVV